MDVSIIIVNYNSLSYIRNLISSIFSKLDGFRSPGVEIIVVDNGSTDGSTGYLEELGVKNKNILFIETGENIGFARASNTGARKARGAFLLFLNPDMEFLSGNLEELIKFYKSYSQKNKVGAVGAKLVNEDGSIQYSCRAFPTLARQFYESYFLHRIFKKSKIFGSYFLSWWNYEHIKEVDWISGAFLFIKKDIFDMFGGFSEQYFMFSEDSDLCLRLYRNGCKNYFYPYLVIKHFDSAIASRDEVAREVQIWKARRLYFRKNYSNLHAITLSFLYFLGVANRMVVYLFASIFTLSKDNRQKAIQYAKVLKSYFSR